MSDATRSSCVSRWSGGSTLSCSVGVQPLLRLVNFAVVVFLATRVPEADFTVGTVHCGLLLAAILHVSRAGFRRQYLSQHPTSQGGAGAWGRCMALGSQLLPWSAMVAAAAVASAVILTASTATAEAHTAFTLHGIAALLELLAEPLHMAATERGHLPALTTARAVATLASAAAAVLLVVSGAASPLMVFSLQRLAFGTVLLCCFVAWAGLQLAEEEVSVQQVLAEAWHLQLLAEANDATKEQEAAGCIGGGWCSMLQGVGELVVAEAPRLGVLAAGSVADCTTLALVAVADPLMEQGHWPLQWAGLVSAFRAQPTEDPPTEPPTDVVFWLLSSLLVGVSVPCTAHTMAQYTKLLALTRYHGPQWAVTGQPLVLLLFTAHWQLRHLCSLVLDTTSAARQAPCGRCPAVCNLVVSAVHAVAVSVMASRAGLRGALATSCILLALRVLAFATRGPFWTARSWSLMLAYLAAAAMYLSTLEYQAAYALQQYYWAGAQLPAGYQLPLSATSIRIGAAVVVFWVTAAMVLDWLLLRLWGQRGAGSMDGGTDEQYGEYVPLPNKPMVVADPCDKEEALVVLV